MILLNLYELKFSQNIVYMYLFHIVAHLSLKAYSTIKFSNFAMKIVITTLNDLPIYMNVEKANMGLHLDTFNILIDR